MLLYICFAFTTVLESAFAILVFLNCGRKVNELLIFKNFWKIEGYARQRSNRNPGKLCTAEAAIQVNNIQ